MKKVVTKLGLRREMLRTLAEPDLAKAAGGDVAACTVQTYLRSGCTLPPEVAPTPQ
jgi:hypothetical protein